MPDDKHPSLLPQKVADAGAMENVPAAAALGKGWGQPEPRILTKRFENLGGSYEE